MPISKRINNLSITSNPNNYFNQESSNDSNGFIHYHPHQQQHPHHQQQHHQPYANHLSNSTNNNSIEQNSHVNMFSINDGQQSTIMEHPISSHSHIHQQHTNHIPNTTNDIDGNDYSPELSAEENPFYYNKNKLLFDLHVERERRNHNNSLSL